MRKTIKVQNLKCQGCVRTIVTELNDVPGLKSVEVEIETSMVSFDYSSPDDMPIVELKLLGLGYPPEGFDNPMITRAKSVVSCALGKIS